MNIFLAVFILIIVFILGKALVNVFGIFKTLFDYFLKGFFNRYFLIWPIEKENKAYLEKYFTYYRRLNDKNKRLFEKRVHKFMKMKTFVARGELGEVSEDMKTLIAASAIQITFGFPGVYFEHFQKIIVYPDSYYSKVRQQYHQGSVHMKGYIILSLKNFLKGFIIENDGINLAMHEMAHALHLENRILNGEYNYFHSKWKNEFVKISKSERAKIKKGEKTLFRNYAATDKYEFFAIAVENFFERPKELRNYNPNIYKVMCGLLNQDPIELQSLH